MSASQTPSTLNESIARVAPEWLFSLAGKRVLVSGASSGMGEAVARAAAAAGATVYAAARRADRLKDLAAAHPAITTITCDVSVTAQRKALVEQILAGGHLDVLINTAGTVGEVVPAESETEEEVDRVMGVNLLAPFRLCQAFGPGMRQAGKGSIINISSISGVVGIGRIPQASYVMSKTGLVGLTRELAAQWGRWGIRINAIAAGYFRSEMTADMFAAPKMAEWVRVRQPLPYTGMPEDFAGTVLLLASDAGRFITGQTFNVDGGWTAL